MQGVGIRLAPWPLIVRDQEGLTLPLVFRGVVLRHHQTGAGSSSSSQHHGRVRLQLNGCRMDQGQGTERSLAVLEIAKTLRPHVGL